MCTIVARADEGEALFYALRSKMLTVKDYTAAVKLKIDVSFMRIPLLKGTLYFKAPDKMRLERKGGISLLPKNNINLTISNLVPTGKVTVIDLGMMPRDGHNYRVLKVVPEEDNGNIVITKIWVDEARMVAVRAETTTRNDGTVIMDLAFGKYVNYGLPDNVTIFMDLKDYQLPKGVTMDYDGVDASATAAKPKTGKGTIQISYLSYDINKGISDEQFTGK
jgi:outer membrane lipoprotein-sorting protein